MGFADGRTYLINGREYPSVTTILSVIDKSEALIPWAAKAERKYYTAELNALLGTDSTPVPCSAVKEKLAEMMESPYQANVLKNQAAKVGSDAHALIEWEIRGLLKQQRGVRPVVSQSSYRAFEEWKRWSESVRFEPLEAEQRVHSEQYGFAGTMDLYARINGKLAVLDWKTSKAIYPEAFLQNVAYRQAAFEMLKPSEQGIILRLPKTEEDPGFEAVEVPTTVELKEFLAAMTLWKFKQRYQWKKQAVKKEPIVSYNPFNPTGQEKELSEFLDQQEERKA